MGRLAKVLALLVLAWTAGPVEAWDRHQDLTALAVRGMGELDGAVAVEPLEFYLLATGGGTVADFVLRHKLGTTVTFPYRLGEQDGKTIPLRAVVAGYADEPDWGMDQDLFDAYPELWKDEYQYMIGSRHGFQTRAVRHMYWPKGYYTPPPPGQRLPARVAIPLGEAPERAQLFFDLSRAAFAAGHPYWGGRFLSWSLHYLEDLTMPFHTVQIPAWEYLQFRADGSLDVDRTARLIVYEHLALDAYPARAAEGDFGAAARSAVESALGGDSAGSFISARELAIAAAEASAGRAKDAGRAALEVFPVPGDAELADPLGSINDAFWKTLAARLAADPSGAQAFDKEASALLAAAAPSVRALVKSALPPPRVDRTEALKRELLRRLERLLLRPVF
jgi:hypothetical protein